MSNIHPTAVIETKVLIGDNVFIGAHVVIREGSTIGDGVVIGHGTVIESGVKIGDRCRIQAQCFFSPKTKLKEDVFVGPGVRFLNDKRILSHGRPGGGPACWEPVEVYSGARIGANCTIAPGVTIGQEVLVGACSYVHCSIGMNECWWGSPATFQDLVPKEEWL